MSEEEVPALKDASELRVSPSMCFHCFDTLLQALWVTYQHQNQHRHHWQFLPAATTGPDAKPQFWKDLPHERIQCPLFVTWEKRRNPSLSSSLAGVLANGRTGTGHSNKDSATYELRGCIGTLSPMPVATALTKYALISALQDSRFSPIHPSELAQLRVAVSLLVKYEQCQNVYDWQVGVHGIIIKFSDRNSSPNYSSRHQYSATYLPEVALEQGWDQRTTVASLIRKAGFSRDISPDLLASIECTRYQSSKLKVTYEDYVLQQQSKFQLSEDVSNTNHQISSAGPFLDFSLKPSPSVSVEQRDSEQHNRGCSIL